MVQTARPKRRTGRVQAGVVGDALPSVHPEANFAKAVHQGGSGTAAGRESGSVAPHERIFPDSDSAVFPTVFDLCSNIVHQGAWPVLSAGCGSYIRVAGNRDKLCRAEVAVSDESLRFLARVFRQADPSVLASVRPCRVIAQPHCSGSMFLLPPWRAHNETPL
jgi:hypothetical protein